MLQVLHSCQARAMALQVAVHAARWRLVGKQPPPPQLPPVPPPLFSPPLGAPASHPNAPTKLDPMRTACACAFVMYTVTVLLNWRLYPGAGLLLREPIKQHPPLPRCSKLQGHARFQKFLQFFDTWRIAWSSTHHSNIECWGKGEGVA